jgi:pyruvate kinase
MHYAIIATLGPASNRVATWHELLAAGATAFRLNTSHLSLAELPGWLESLSSYNNSVQHVIPLVLDLQGSKWRIGELEAVELTQDQRVELVYGQTMQSSGVLPVPHADFFAAAPLSDGEIVLNDARVRLAIEEIWVDSITARVIQAGPLAARKGITFRACEYRSEALSEKDQAIYEQTNQLPGVQYAISYVKDGLEMAHYRRILGSGSRLIAKLERGPAMADSEAISRYADELWVCRGDLGAELGLASMAQAVHSFSTQVNNLPVPAMMAGQVLEHLTEYSTPTRSEVCYMHDCLQAGYRGFVLSDETAIGHDPVGACKAAAIFDSVYLK